MNFGSNGTMMQNQMNRYGMASSSMPNTYNTLNNIGGRLDPMQGLGGSSMRSGNSSSLSSSGLTGLASLGNQPGGVSNTAIQASRSLNFGSGGSDSGGSMWSAESMWGGKNGNGWIPGAVTAGSSLMGAFMGMKQYGLAKEQLAQSKAQFNKQYESNKRLTNERLSTRHERRRKEGRTDQSTAEYMKKYGVQ